MTGKNSFFSIYDDVRWVTVANVLTGSRILLAPVVVLSFYKAWWLIAFLCCVYAALTDFFDGFIARWCKDQTNLGKVLDPIADKMFLIAFFASIAFIPSPLFPIPWWFVLFLVIREAIILYGTYSLMKSRTSFQVQPTLSGKLSTCMQLLFIIWMFVCYYAAWCPLKTYGVGLILLVFVGLFSLGQYISIGWLVYRSSANDYP